ncbi:ribonuclease H-like domain-containing protein [Tanacetum coccineum]
MSHFGRSGSRTTANDLFPLFDKYGKVVDIFIPKDRRTGDSRGFAFVRYKYSDEAQKAVDRLDGRELIGREITVQFAKYGPNAERMYRDDYRDRGYRRSRSRSRDRYDRYRGRDRGHRYRSRSRSYSPDYDRVRGRSRYDDERWSRSRSIESPGPRRSLSPRTTPTWDKSPASRSPSPKRSLSPNGRSLDSRSPSPRPAEVSLLIKELEITLDSELGGLNNILKRVIFRIDLHESGAQTCISCHLDVFQRLLLRMHSRFSSARFVMIEKRSIVADGRDEDDDIVTCSVDSWVGFSSIYSRLSESRKVDCSSAAIFRIVSCFLPLRDTLLDLVGAYRVANPDLPLKWCEFLLWLLSVHWTQFLWILVVLVSLFAMAILISSLDASNPLHLHANDSNGTPLISIKLTGVENYRIWASAIKLGLQTKNKMGFITGSVLKSDYVASNLLSEQWDRCNAVVLSWILGSLSQDVYLGHVFSDNVALVWKELQETYDRIDGSIVFTLLQKINSFKQDFMQFLMGLDDVYQPIRSSLLTREILPEVKDAFLIIAREESHRGISSSPCQAEKPHSICDLKREKVLGTGSEYAGLYVFYANCDKLAVSNQRGIPLYFWTECVLTATYLINRLPSSVLNGKSPFSLVYGREPNLSHLRSFGCLCFAAVVKGFDKFSEKAEKCVLIGYASGKKAYKLFSLENRNVLYSRDVKFYETIFPYKMSSDNTEFSKSSGNINNDISTLNFFDNFESETTAKTSSSPNDDEEGPSGRDGNVHQPVPDSENQPGHGDQHFATPIDDENPSEGNGGSHLEVPIFENINQNETEEVSPDIRRSSRPSKLPAKLNEFVLDGKVKYGLHRYVNHTLLRGENYCFVTNLNKSVEPSSFQEASKDINWINAMNEELHALYENNT